MSGAITLWNENEGRVYPLVSPVDLGAGNWLPFSAFLDASFILGPRVQGGGIATLTRIVKTGVTLRFDIEITDVGVTFEVERGLTAPPGGLTVVAEQGPDFGMSYLRFGSLQDLSELADGTYEPPDAEFEPATVAVRQLSVYDVRIANDRNVSFEEESLDGDAVEIPLPPEMSPEVLDAADVLKLSAGYNMRVVADPNARRLRLMSRVGLGRGELCGWVDREDPQNENPEDPGESCMGLVYTINRVAPLSNGDFVVSSASGFRVDTSVAHTLRVYIDENAIFYMCEPEEAS